MNLIMIMRKDLKKINRRWVTHFIPRTARSVTETPRWKVSECKRATIAFSPILFHDIMKDEYFQHHLLLVHVLNLLMSSSISKDMLKKAKKCLHEYVKRFKKLYGERHLTCNLHQFLHLIETVEKFGPLYKINCFSSYLRRKY